jgi:hypothetical protein
MVYVYHSNIARYNKKLAMLLVVTQCSNPVRGKLLFPCARNFTLTAKYWLVPGTDLSVSISL